MIWVAVGLVVAGLVAVWGVVVGYQARADAARALMSAQNAKEGARCTIIGEMDWLFRELEKIGVAHVETRKGKRVLERGKS